MRVVHINYAYADAHDAYSMLARFPTLTRLCEEQTRLGACVTVLQRFWRDEDVCLNGITYHLRADNGGHNARPWTIPTRLHRLVRGLQADIVHVNGLVFPSQVAQLRAWLGQHVKIVVQHHGEWPSPGRLRLLQRRLLRFADGFFFNGADNAADWRVLGAIHPNQPVFEVIEGSCDFTPVSVDRARREIGVAGSPVVLWVKRLHWQKDPLTVLNGFACTLAQLPRARLYMVYSEDPMLPQVRKLLDQPPLAEHVELIGHVPHEQLPTWYSAADLFLSSSLREGSNYALIESMACGALPVCSDIPPHRFIVGELGVLWQAGNERACADALVRAAARIDESLRLNIRRRFEKELSYTAAARQSLKAYQALIEAR
jgi:glycosyltransferase involved in cell wall biosynthesis